MRLGLPGAKVQRIDEVLADPQIIERGMLVEQDHPILGKIQLGNLPFRMSAGDTTIRQPAPLLGEHNREIAAELGFDQTEIDGMIADEVLYAEESVG